MSETIAAVPSSIETYGNIAHLDLDPTARAGRYSFQADAMRRIIPDILPKLKLEPHHRLLDIGCGTGALLIPLSYLVAEVIGLDHPNVVAELSKRLPNDRISLIGGGFPGTVIDGMFDRIVAYSVMQCLPTFEDAKAFALAACGLLQPGGRLLIADFPNKDRQERLRKTEAGKAFEREWAELRAAQGEVTPEQRAAIEELGKARQLGGMTNEQICDLLLTIRAAGYEAFLAEQDPELPFGRTREDLVITRL
jgi:SAM-dependent methyltransferase